MGELACGNRMRWALDLLGRRWAFLILAMLAQRPSRFSEIARAVPGMSERVMNDRLQELVEAGLVARRVEPGPPVTTTYELTAAGQRLRPAIRALVEWAESIPAPRNVARTRR